MESVTTHTQYLVETRDLCKQYGKNILALDHLSMTVRPGEVYGFLGPNGAGKTTTLKLLLGLIRPTSGTANVLGERPGTSNNLAQVGALVEAPAFYPYLSGRDNLLVLARYLGVPPTRVETALAQVGLAERAKDKFKGYSLGMKQRLGVAAALLKAPKLLILDEPTNGLDPMGIQEMRVLIRDVAQAGRSVLLSSHLLGEVEATCDRVAILHGGKLIAESSVTELRGQGRVLARVHPLDTARRVAEQMVGSQHVQVVNGMLQLGIDPTRTAQINRAFVQAGVDVSELRPVQSSLEQVYMQLVGNPAGQQ